MRWHDVQTEFHDNLFDHSNTISHVLNNFKDSNVGITSGMNL
jgi:hypothetical protein